MYVKLYIIFDMYTFHVTSISLWACQVESVSSLKVRRSGISLLLKLLTVFYVDELIVTAATVRDTSQSVQWFQLKAVKFKLGERSGIL